MADLYGPGYPVPWNHPDARLRGDRWLQAILASHGLTPGSKVLAAALVRIHFNWTTGQCNPSQDTLAVETAQCSRSVEKQLEKLREAGCLAWRKGFQSSNRYWLLITPNCGRELSIPNDERELNTEPSAGIETTQNRTEGRPIPNAQGLQDRTEGGGNPCLTHEANPLSGADWPLIWESFQGWPNLPVTATEARAKKVWLQMQDELPPAKELVGRIRAQGARLRDADSRATAPHNWLERDRGWASIASEFVDQATIDAARDKADKYFKRGKYAEARDGSRSHAA